MIKLNKTKKIIIGLSLIFLAVMVWLLFLKNSTSKVRKIDISGTVVDSTTLKPLDNISLRIDNQKTTTDYSGKFSLKDVYNNQLLIVSSNNLYQDIQIPINNTQNFYLKLNNNQLLISNYLVSFENQRLYKKIYQYLSNNYKNTISENGYVEEKNQWFDKITDKGKYSLHVSYDVVNNQMIYQITDNQKVIKTITEKNILEYNNQKWTLTKTLLKTN